MAWETITNITGPPGADGSDADVTGHEAASDPHPQYMTSAEVGTAIAGKADQTDVDAALSDKADDSAVVHLTGTETIAGAKTFSTAPQIPVGSLLANPVRRDDARLSDARTPTAHKSTHVTGGSDALAPSDIGAAASTHTHNANDVNAGTLNAARLPLVSDPPVSLTYNAALAVDANAGNLRTCALTGNVTSWNITNGGDGQKVLVWFTATASRTIDLSGLTKLDFIPDSLTVDTGAPAAVLLLRIGSTWYLIAAGAVG
jgi:hypothetical protein